MNNQEYNETIINFYSNLHIHAAYERDDYIEHAFNKFTRNFNSTLAFDFLNESNSKNNNIISWIENSPEQYLNTIDGRKFGGNLAIRDTRESIKKILSSIPELGKDVLENKNLINALHQFGAEIKKLQNTILAML